MEWDDLKHFLAVARSGSLSEAARGLKSSAATVGRHVASLEQKLGARLFDHQQSGYVLTETGQAIRIRAEQVEEAVLAVEREASGRDRRTTGKVRIATTEDIATFVIVPQLPNFRRDYPDISIELVCRYDLANLTKRDADVAVRTVRPDQGNLALKRIGMIDLALYVARSYAKARDLKPVVDLDTLDVVTWVEELAHMRGGPWLTQNASGATVALRTNSTRAMFNACKAGVGAAILPCFAADPEPDLMCLVPPERVASLETWLVVHRDLARTARVRAAMDFLAKLGSRLSRQGKTPPARPDDVVLETVR